MPSLLIVGGGLFGSVAAAYARRRGIEAMVFDPGLDGAASPAAAGLFGSSWMGRKLQRHFPYGLPVLEQLYGVREICLTGAEGQPEKQLFVPPSAILEPEPVRESVTAVGDGWLEAGGRRHEGWVYLAAGVWCARFLPDLGVYGKTGAALIFAGEGEARTHPIGPGRQALVFPRDPGTTYFSDGTAERHYTPEHDRQTLARAAALGWTTPLHHLWGHRPYVPGGPVFQKLGEKTWLGTGGRKLGTILAASFARRLIEMEVA